MERDCDAPEDVDCVDQILQRVWPLPGDRLTEDEMVGVPELNQQQQLHFDLRCMIMGRWQDDPTSYVSLTDFIEEDISTESWKYMAVVHHYLERRGYINHGVLDRPLQGGGPLRFAPLSPPHVIVIGAGLAGLACAKQLHRMGYHTTVVEARDRVGGRCQTDRSHQHPVELGGFLMYGTDGHPLRALAKQLGLGCHVVQGEIPVFAPTGNPIDPATDEATEAHWLALTAALTARRRHLQQAGEDVSQRSAGREWQTLVAETGVWPGVDSQLLAWHLARLEYREFADLEALALSAWEMERGEGQKELPGPPWMLAQGTDALLEALARQLPTVRLGCVVTAVEWGPTRGVVHLAGGEVLEGDAIVCSVPLGVLKRRAIEFSPPLPAPKLIAIDRLGFGTVNQLALIFRTAWWMPDADRDIFGCITEERGMGFQFWNLVPATGAPVLLVQFAARAAIDVEAMDEAGLVDRAVHWLHLIFQDDLRLERPIAYHLSRWGCDPYAQGAGPYLAQGSGPADLQALGNPLPGLFFAGDATEPRCIGTMAAAYLSGLRAAGDVCDQLCPRPPLNEADLQEFQEAAFAEADRINTELTRQAEAQAAAALAVKEELADEGRISPASDVAPDEIVMDKEEKKLEPPPPSSISDLPRAKKRSAPSGRSSTSKRPKPVTPAPQKSLWCTGSTPLRQKPLREIREIGVLQLTDRPHVGGGAARSGPIMTVTGREEYTQGRPTVTLSTMAEGTAGRRRGQVGFDLVNGQYRSGEETPLAKLREARLTHTLQKLKQMKPAEIQKAAGGDAALCRTAIAVRSQMLGGKGGPTRTDPPAPPPNPAAPAKAPRRTASEMEAQAEKTAAVWLRRKPLPPPRTASAREAPSAAAAGPVVRSGGRRAEREALKRGVGELVRHELAKALRIAGEPSSDREAFKARARALAHDCLAELGPHAVWNVEFSRTASIIVSRLCGTRLAPPSGPRPTAAPLGVYQADDGLSFSPPPSPASADQPLPPPPAPALACAVMEPVLHGPEDMAPGEPNPLM